MNREQFKRRASAYTYRILDWGHKHVPVGVRSVIGLLFIAGGVLGFLPILGFWMVPLGLAFIALDVPFTRHRIVAWMQRLKVAGNVD